jgi:hypothetical protein
MDRESALLDTARGATGLSEPWRRDTARDKHGVHEYASAAFGLDTAALRERLRFHRERFAVARSG